MREDIPLQPVRLPAFLPGFLPHQVALISRRSPSANINRTSWMATRHSTVITNQNVTSWTVHIFPELKGSSLSMLDFSFWSMLVGTGTWWSQSAGTGHGWGSLGAGYVGWPGSLSCEDCDFIFVLHLQGTMCVFCVCLGVCVCVVINVWWLYWYVVCGVFGQLYEEV